MFRRTAVPPGFYTMLYTLAGGGTLCGVAALVLLIVSTATDFWMQYRYSGSSANQGLWRFCINRKCHAHTITVGEYCGMVGTILIDKYGTV